MVKTDGFTIIVTGKSCGHKIVRSDEYCRRNGAGVHKEILIGDFSHKEKSVCRHIEESVITKRKVQC